MKLLSTLLVLTFLVGCSDPTGGDTPASSTTPWNGEVQVYGGLRAMFHQGQTGSMVSLDSLLPNSDLYAVGALTDLSGEVTVIGGKAYLSYPDGADTARTEAPSQTNAGATLLVATAVPTWRGYTVQAPIRFGEIDAEIGRLAAAAGMNLDARFPFLMKGHFEDLRWHVIDGNRLTDGGTSHEDHLAAAAKLQLDRAAATLVGFYSKGDQGVFTHMGSTTHIHCVIDDPLSTGHVDHVIIPAGTEILFPAKMAPRPDE